ncbi:hypothetical protein Q8A64_03975 [Oxalobacteraceae bacterium R-40]|uniref:Uncharacterized protein n=1 Tax=Keguizhuia sedimenti TaxID=3064264 RepID=A0ABU1BN83_9BURK|nr:hypothetical protein [Oxalobacteraceae bacterium R-40]
MKKFLACITMAASVIASGNVLAHGDKPKHGGIVQSANDLSFEMVNKDNATLIYVEDHGKKLSTAGAAGKLTLLNGAEKSELPLEPAGENMLAAKGDTKLAKGTKAIASITFANKETVNVRFAVR